MDNVEKALWIILISSLITFGTAVSVFGQFPESDKYEYLGIRHDVRPQVCLFEPNPTHVDWKYWKDVEFESWRAILDWQVEMQEFLP